MPWVVGIDEAGYGPNLGPLVQAAVAVRLPEADPAGWETLRPHVRRCSDGNDKRVLVDDSKKVHSGPNGVARLERGLASVVGVPPGPLGDWLRAIALPGIAAELAEEHWYDPADAVPLGVEACPDLRPTLAELGVEARVVATSLICAPLFNKVIAGSGSKGTVLTAGVCGLLEAVARSVPAGEPVLVQVDQLGGRRFYGPLLQAAFADCELTIEVEGADESRYRVTADGREVRVVVGPRADGEGVSVALASMLAKYLREVCMKQFNRFWAQHVPDLKPTAGYPTDAKRFYEAIRPAMEKLGIAEDAVWRVK
jgi:hypothetical protein